MNEIFDRMDIKTFKNQLLEPQKIALLLKAAMAAPSAENQRPWEFYAVRNKISLMRLSTCGAAAKCVKDAPYAIVVCSRADVQFPELVGMDIGAAVENIMLEATSIGLGSTCIAVSPYEDRIASVRKILDLADDMTPFAIVAVGYPAAYPKAKDSFDQSRIHYIN